MLRDYSDITDQLGEPEWWDDNGTPRYCAFRPYVATIYDKYVALVEIECHGCDRAFRVSVGQPAGRLFDEWRPTELPTTESTNRFHYGDPPRHSNCVGETMNCWTLRILEFWERDDNAGLSADPWRRRPDLEFVYGPGVT
ncbi:MAG: hypothetical protein EPO35_00545 [Acidobacteria bacterium]|nr:MAG: hypothetical protein EPO35_00545 [Acidobacteriota bacterium]